jgi:hypothetical protein
MTKTFTHIGAAIYKGKDKFRFTNGRADARIKTMTKEGFENIEFVELPGEMTKEDAFKTVMAADLAARRGLTIPTAETVADAGDGTVDGDQRMVA